MPFLHDHKRRVPPLNVYPKFSSWSLISVNLAVVLTQHRHVKGRLFSKNPPPSGGAIFRLSKHSYRSNINNLLKACFDPTAESRFIAEL